MSVRRDVIPIGSWRRTLTRKWLRRVGRSKDPFDRFFSAWMALIVLAEEYRRNTGGEFLSGDHAKIITLVRGRSEQVAAALDSSTAELSSLARRRGSSTAGEILDTNDHHLRVHLQLLSRLYGFDLPQALSARTADDQKACIEAVAELLIKVRNNTFHGQKDYDDSQDVALLNLVTPIIIRIVKHCDI